MVSPGKVAVPQENKVNETARIVSGIPPRVPCYNFLLTSCQVSDTNHHPRTRVCECQKGRTANFEFGRCDACLRSFFANQAKNDPKSLWTGQSWTKTENRKKRKSYPSDIQNDKTRLFSRCLHTSYFVYILDKYSVTFISVFETSKIFLKSFPNIIMNMFSNFGNFGEKSDKGV